MEMPMAAIELTGRIDEHRHLQLDSLLPVSDPMRARGIVLYPIEDEWDETEWLQAAVHNPVFDFLNDPGEDIYSLTDGNTFARIRKVEYYHSAKRNEYSSEAKELNAVRRNPDTI